MLSSICRYKMNSSSTNFDYLPDLIYFASSFWILLMMLFSYISLPFYIYVQKVNRQREESFPPIMKQFYKIIKIAYFTFFMTIVMDVVFWLWFFGFYEIPVILFIIVFIFVTAALISQYLAFIVTLQVFHILIFLIAIQNLLRFFFPSRFSLLQNLTDRFVKRIYIFFALKEIACFLVTIAFYSDLLPSNTWDAARYVYLVPFFILNVLISFLSPLIYIPIIWRTRKNKTVMYSQQHAHLYNYVFWQNVMVFLFKTVAVPYIFEKDEIVMSVLINDFSTIPLAVQLSYLWCNRNSLFTNFNIKTFFKVLFGKADTSVHPEPIVYSIT